MPSFGGTKWGTSQAFGTPGGVVTWSIIDGGVSGVRSAFERAAMNGQTPALLVSPQIRPFVRSVIERFRPITVVLSQNEIHPKAKIKTVAQI